MRDTCVARVPVFASLSPHDQQRVEAVARPAHLRAGETAYSVDDDASQLVVLHAGRLKIVRCLADGSERLVRVLLPGEFTGETSVFTRQRPDGYAIALDESQLCVFRHDDLEVLITQHPDIGLRMLAAVSERLCDTERRLSSVISRGVESRLADYLLDLPSTWRDGIATVTLPLAKKDVAALLDTTPESFSRALKSLAEQGLIVVRVGRSLSITRPEQLQQLIDAD